MPAWFRFRSWKNAAKRSSSPVNLLIKALAWQYQMLPAGLLSCFGIGEAGGRLPVSIPALDDSYRPASEIIWPSAGTT